ncbi:MAG: gliding motility lipoprotein GldH [Microscillaceae bacterium]
MKRQMLPVLNPLALAFCLALWACNPQHFYEKNYELPQKKWAVDSVLVFHLDIKEVQQAYNFYYNLRCSADYPFQNLYVTFFLENEQGKVVAEELQNITLFEAKTGRPLGEGFGNLYSYQLPIPKLSGFRFPKPGKYTYRLVQYMRRDPLPEVVSVGLKVEKAP